MSSKNGRDVREPDRLSRPNGARNPFRLQRARTARSPAPSGRLRKSKVSRHAGAGLLAQDKVSLPVASSGPARGRDVVTGRTTHERCAVLESQFAALKVKRARASEALLRGPPGARRSLGRAGADYWPHNIVIGSVGAHARQSAARERHRCARLRRACGR
jgi:hypothetical protein